MSSFADPTLPGLATALDAGAIRELLGRALPEVQEGLEITGVHIMDVRYQHDGPCWLLYRLKLRQGKGRSSHHLLSARLLRTGERVNPPPESLVSRFRERGEGLLRTPVSFIPEANMVAYAFPLDIAMPRLFDAFDPAVLRKHLNRFWARRGVRVREVYSRRLGYTPQARAAFRHEVLAESADGVPEMRRLIGKMHAKKAAHRLFAGSWALWRAAGKKVNLAPPVGYLGALGLTLQEEIRGERLGGLTSEPSFRKRARQTGRMLAALHALSLPLTTRRRPQDEADVVRRWAGVLAAMRPDLCPRVERLRDRLASGLLARVRMSASVHGDFHHTNVLVQEDRVAIIDLDEMAFGDPMLDVGRFLASLRIPALRAFGDIRGLTAAGEAFIAEYMRRFPGDPERARLFEAASLVTAAASSFRIQRPNWAEEIEILLEESERVSEKAGSSLTAAVSAPPPPGPVADRGRWARDPVYMQAALDPYVRAAYGFDVEGCRVVAGPARERGERLRYVFKGRAGEEKRSVTLHGVAWRVHGGRSFLTRLEALWKALEGAPHAPLLPRPVAYLRALSLIVWEVPSGVRFSSLLGTGEALAAASRVAEAMAALHRVNVELENPRSLDTELRSLRLKVERVGDLRPRLAGKAVPLFQAVEARIQSAAARRGPIVRMVHPHHVLIGERVAFGKVEDATLSHPLLDAGDFLARLTAMGLDGKRVAGDDVSRVAGRFRRSYVEAGGASEEDIATFEAGALLRLACAKAREAVPDERLEHLLDQAAARLA